MPQAVIESTPAFVLDEETRIAVERLVEADEKVRQITKILTRVSDFLQGIKQGAEQFTQPDRWRLILSAAFRFFFGGKVIGSPGRLADDPGNCRF